MTNVAAASPVEIALPSGVVVRVVRDCHWQALRTVGDQHASALRLPDPNGQGISLPRRFFLRLVLARELPPRRVEAALLIPLFQNTAGISSLAIGDKRAEM
jgi:hypothetical protein